MERSRRDLAKVTLLRHVHKKNVIYLVCRVQMILIVIYLVYPSDV